MAQDTSQAILPWKRMLEKITSLDDLTEKRILNLRALAYSTIYLPLLRVDPKAFAKWSSNQRPELETIIEYDAHGQCVMIKGRPYLVHQTITMFFNRLFYSVAMTRGLQNFDFGSDMKVKRFKLVSPFENTQLVPEAYLKTKTSTFPSFVLIIGPSISMRNIVMAARRWLLGTSGVTEAVLAFTLTINPLPPPLHGLLRSKAFEENWGLSEDEIRTIYSNVEDLAIHVLDWYTENSRAKLGGEYVASIHVFDRRHLNDNGPVATLHFSATDYRVITGSPAQGQQQQQVEEPVLELKGETVRLEHLACMLHGCIKSEANRIAVVLARYKLSQLGISLDRQRFYDLGWRKFRAPVYVPPERFFENEYAITEIRREPYR